MWDIFEREIYLKWHRTLFIVLQMKLKIAWIRRVVIPDDAKNKAIIGVSRTNRFRTCKCETNICKFSSFWKVADEKIQRKWHGFPRKHARNVKYVGRDLLCYQKLLIPRKNVPTSVQKGFRIVKYRSMLMQARTVREANFTECSRTNMALQLLLS